MFPCFKWRHPKTSTTHYAKARAQKKAIYKNTSTNTINVIKHQTTVAPPEKHYENTTNTYQHNFLHQTIRIWHYSTPRRTTSPHIPAPKNATEAQPVPTKTTPLASCRAGQRTGYRQQNLWLTKLYRCFPPWNLVSSCIYGFILDLLDMPQFDQASVFWKHRDIRVLLQLVCFLAGCRLSLVQLISCCCAWFGTIHHGGATWKATFHRDASWSGTCQHLTGLENATAPHWKARGKTFAPPQ